MMTPFFFCAAITFISSCVSFGYATQALKASNTASRTNAAYAFSRSFALVILAGAPLINHSTPWLIAAAITMILVQAGDALVGLSIRDNLKTYGPAITSLANLIALTKVLI
ncbi:MAG: hypothetical protein ABIS59_03825 [Candidatus Saccharibacteria bacterium]